MICKKANFSGQVQGVGFRFTCQQIAGNFRVTGTVRNLSDGSVELIAQGEDGEVNGFINEILQTMSSNIGSKKISDYEVDSKHHSFRISY